MEYPPQTTSQIHAILINSSIITIFEMKPNVRGAILKTQNYEKRLLISKAEQNQDYKIIVYYALLIRRKL